MKHFVAILGVLAVCAALASAQEASPPSKSPLFGKGHLQEVRKPLEQILQFTFKGPNLTVDRQAWDKAAESVPKVERPVGIRVEPPPAVEALFRQIQSSAGALSSGMSSGGKEREIRFTGNNLSGRLHTRADSVRMLVEEVQSPQRSLEFYEEGQGGFRLQMTHPDGDFILLNQPRNGRCAVVALTGGRMFAGQGESFVALFRQHRQEMETHVLPVLDQLGIHLVLPPHTPNVRNAVLALLARTPEVLAEGRKLLLDLDSEKFDVREKASQLLTDRFEIYRDLIQEKLQEKTLSLEVQARLQSLVGKQGDATRVSQTVAVLDLLQDAGYLVSLLDHVAAEERPRLIRQLEKTTGQKFGSDPTAWKDWARKRPK